MGWRLATCDVPDRPLSYFFTLGSRFNTSVRIGSTADCTDNTDNGGSSADNVPHRTDTGALLWEAQTQLDKRQVRLRATPA